MSLQSVNNTIELVFKWKEKTFPLEARQKPKFAIVFMCLWLCDWEDANKRKMQFNLKIGLFVGDALIAVNVTAYSQWLHRLTRKKREKKLLINTEISILYCYNINGVYLCNK